MTLPRCHSFSRCSSIPYFVVFSTNTGSSRLVEEIAADATIAVSLIRHITVTPQPAPPSPICPDTPPSSDESDSLASSFAPRRPRLLRFPIRTPTRSHTREESKPLPELPQEAVSTSRTVQTQVSIGFPRRPREGHTSRGFPDGFYKGRLQLQKDMLPSVDWPGLNVNVRIIAMRGD